MTNPASASTLPFDPDRLREKYRQERDKRIRPAHNDQYIEVKGDFSHFVDDPYVEPGFTREPICDQMDVIIIGGGFGGLITAAKLREVGVGNIRVIEKAGDFGGTWYWNRYPGAQCDIESYIYLPLLEEMGYMSTEKYAHGPEILDYAQAIGRKYGLYEDACFQTQVTELAWNDEQRAWIVKTDRGDVMKARFIAMSNGPLSRPKLPGINGIDTFTGHSFHTSRWDYAYTGGDTHGNLDRLKDKRVGIIGTGATAIQCVPHLADAAKHLYVFQRTPSSVDYRNNRPTDPHWVKSLTPGWHHERMVNFNVLVSGGQQDEDLVNDGWTDIIRNLSQFRPRTPTAESAEDTARAMELADFQKMEQIRARVDAVVADPQTAEALKPYYRMFCKRPCFSDDYLPAFNRANVTLVDTHGKGVEGVRGNLVVAAGNEYDVDCLIFATGFEVGTAYTRRSGYDIIGRNGLHLSDKWRNGLATFHGLLSHQFPNCFFLGITQTGLTPNFTHMLKEQAEHIAFLIHHCMSNGASCVEATQAAEDEWVSTIRELSGFNVEFQQNCTPGYYNSEGDPANVYGIQAAIYGAGSEAFFELLRTWRSRGDFQGITLS